MVILILPRIRTLKMKVGKKVVFLILPRIRTLKIKLGKKVVMIQNLPWNLGDLPSFQMSLRNV